MDIARRPFAIVSLLWLIALAGCAGGGQTGPALESLASMTPPRGGTARIVVMRTENGFMGAGDRSFGIKLDEQPMGDLMTGSFVYRDTPAGPHQIGADLWDIPGVTRYDVNAVAGRTYYVLAKLNENVNAMYGAQIVGGLAGKFIVAGASGMGGNKGAIDLTPVSEADAKRLIASLKPAQ